MVDRKSLKSISALNSAEKAWLTNDVALDVYVKKLAEFTDGLSAHEEAIKSALAEDNKKLISERLTVVWDMLVQIHADKMADDCLKKIGEINNLGRKHLELFIDNFFSSVSSLSIDIQMVIYNKDTENTVKTANPVNKKQTISILAVDDSAFFLQELKNCLQDTPYNLACVVSGKAALRFLEKKMVDLIILDIEMPIMNGYEVAQEIRSMGERVPIIFLTGNAKKEYVLRAMKAGAVDFIVKPIKKEQVLEKIAKYA